MIRMNDVTAVYDNGIRAVNKASLRVDEGEFVFLVGASGSGKTTIIKLLTAEVRPPGRWRSGYGKYFYIFPSESPAYML